jgi:hypothetical protein
MEPVYQCCYTNATRNEGNRTFSGWQVVAASPGIPSDAYDACVKLQNANAALCADAVDEQGSVLVLDEYSGDGSYLYVIRTRFGLSDRLGRPNMFSHALIFPLKNNVGVLRDPNYFLALDAAAFLGGEGQLPWEGTPPCTPFLSLEQAMTLAGLDQERWATLLRCVYAQTEAKGVSPLYIQYEGSALRIRGLLHCIYAGLPRYLVKKLRIAACPTANDSGKHLVFSRNARGRERYFIPQSGENTVLTPRMESKLSRMGYVDYAVCHVPFEKIPDFFGDLELLAVSLGDSSASSPQILKLAFQFNTHAGVSDFTNAELEGNLVDALRLPVSDNQWVGMLLTRMLGEMNRRGQRLAPESETLLDGWLAHTSSQELLEAGRDYQNQKHP